MESEGGNPGIGKGASGRGRGKDRKRERRGRGEGEGTIISPCFDYQLTHATVVAAELGDAHAPRTPARPIGVWPISVQAGYHTVYYG